MPHTGPLLNCLLSERLKISGDLRETDKEIAFEINARPPMGTAASAAAVCKAAQDHWLPSATAPSQPEPRCAAYDYSRGPPEWHQFRKEFQEFADAYLCTAPHNVQKDILLLSITGDREDLELLQPLHGQKDNPNINVSELMDQIGNILYPLTGQNQWRANFFTGQLADESFRDYGSRIEQAFYKGFLESPTATPETAREQEIYREFVLDTFTRGLREERVKEDVFDKAPKTMDLAVAAAEESERIYQAGLDEDGSPLHPPQTYPLFQIPHPPVE